MNVLAVDKWNLTEAEWLTQWVRYEGNGRKRELGGRELKVIDVRTDGRAVAVDGGIVGKQWVAVSSLSVVNAPEEKVMTQSAMDEFDPFATSKARKAIENEIKRHEDKLAELRTALKVLDSL